MKQKVMLLLAVILSCLAVIVSCASYDNEGGMDWATVEMSVDLLSSSRNGSLMATSSNSSTTSVIYAVPATVESVTSDASLSGAFDRQIMDEATATVTLKVPLNQSLKLAIKMINGTVTLAQAVSAEAYMYGLSAAFTVDSNTTSKTVTIGGGKNLTGTWSFVDGNGATGINKDPSAGDGESPQLLSFDCGNTACASENGLYATWTENNGTQWQIRVAKWDGSSTWAAVGGGETTGINHVTTNEARQPHLLSYNGRLYAIWREAYGSGSHPRVAKWKDSSWEFVDGGGNTGLSKEPSTTEEYCDPIGAVVNNKLYVTWSEHNGTAEQIRVVEYDGSSFTFIGNTGTTGINKYSNQSAYTPFPADVDSTLFVTWKEVNASGGESIRVAKWSGSAWAFVDGDGSTGIEKSSATSGGDPELLYLNNELYIAWSEDTAGGITQIRAAKWGCSGECWEFIDGGGETGLNKDNTKNAFLPRLTAFNSKVYATWMEMDDSGTFHARVAEYDGSKWSFVDGDGTEGINRDSSKPALVPALAVHDSRLFATWHEMGDNQKKQVRVAVAETQ